MAAKESYLVRGPDGRMATVIARSVRGALRTYMDSRRDLSPGGIVSVKVRGGGDWENFKVSK